MYKQQNRMGLSKCVAALVISGALGMGQQAPTAVPLPTLYRTFLKSVTDFDQAAQAQELQGKNGDELRAHYGNLAGLSKAQNDQLRQIAAQTKAAVAVKDAQASAIIQAARAKFPGGRVSSAKDIPPPPAELKQLSEERDALVMAQMEALRSAMGKSAATKLDNFVQVQFAKQVQPVQFTPRPAGAISKNPLSPTPAGGSR